MAYLQGDRSALMSMLDRGRRRRHVLFKGRCPDHPKDLKDRKGFMVLGENRDLGAHSIRMARSTRMAPSIRSTRRAVPKDHLTGHQ